MELSSIIIGVAFLALFILPFVWLNMKRNQNENELVTELNNYAKDSGSLNCVTEMCSNLVIGLDKTTNFVFFVKRLNNGFIKQKVDLSNVKSCSLKSETNENKVSDFHDIQIEKLELHFNTKDHSKSVIFTFFDIKDGSELTGETQLITKWAELCSAQLYPFKEVLNMDK